MMMKQITQKILLVVFFTSIVSPITFSQQTDSSSYFPLGFWGIWIAKDEPPFTSALSVAQWIQERDNWRDIKGNFLVAWTPMSVEDTVMKFADENNYKMAVSNSNCAYPLDYNPNSLVYWLRNRSLADSNEAVAVM
jgi:hypothetical protein